MKASQVGGNSCTIVSQQLVCPTAHIRRFLLVIQLLQFELIRDFGNRIEGTYVHALIIKAKATLQVAVQDCPKMKHQNSLQRRPKKSFDYHPAPLLVGIDSLGGKLKGQSQERRACIYKLLPSPTLSRSTPCMHGPSYAQRDAENNRVHQSHNL